MGCLTSVAHMLPSWSSHPKEWTLRLQHPETTECTGGSYCPNRILNSPPTSQTIVLDLGCAAAKSFHHQCLWTLKTVLCVCTERPVWKWSSLSFPCQPCYCWWTFFVRLVLEGVQRNYQETFILRTWSLGTVYSFPANNFPAGELWKTSPGGCVNY